MVGRRSLCIFGMMAVFLASAAATADEQSAEKALQEKGLRRVGNHFALPDEVELAKLVRAAEPMRRKVVDALRDATAAEQRIRDKEQLIATCLQQRIALRAQLQQAKSVQQYNSIVTALHELADRVTLLENDRKVEEAAKAARQAANAVREEFIEALLKARKLHDQIEQKYADLAADPKVAEAVKEYSEASERTCQLGPSAGFNGNARKLQRLEESILSESIDIRHGQGDLWFVSVMFNGQHALEISIDTGSTVIALPWALAEKMGVTPSSEDPTVKMQLADGRIIEAKQIYLDSVRVGKFTEEKVEAAVFPQELTEAEPLLGLSFLKHFSYKIDTGHAKLIMARVQTGDEPRPRRSR